MIRPLRVLLQEPHYICDTLVRKVLLRSTRDGLQFSHALVRDGIYGSLTHARRWELHRAAAAILADDPVLRAEPLDRAGDAEAPRAFGGTVVAGLPAALLIAIGGHHQHWQVWASLLDFAKEREAVHPRHVDVGEKHDQLRTDLGELIERLLSRGGEVKRGSDLACLAVIPLAECSPTSDSSSKTSILTLIGFSWRRRAAAGR
jgi:hypothetical protein